MRRGTSTELRPVPARWGSGPIDTLPNVQPTLVLHSAIVPLGPAPSPLYLQPFPYTSSRAHLSPVPPAHPSPSPTHLFPNPLLTCPHLPLTCPPHSPVSQPPAHPSPSPAHLCPPPPSLACPRRWSLPFSSWSLGLASGPPARGDGCSTGSCRVRGSIRMVHGARVSQGDPARDPLGDPARDPLGAWGSPQPHRTPIDPAPRTDPIYQGP